MIPLARIATQISCRAMAGLRGVNSAWGLPGLLAGAIFLLGPALPGTARAVEFKPPPGMNVPRQQNLLKERVKKIAEDLVGDKLVEVVVNVGYARTEKKRRNADPSKIKLPGFNRFISPTGTGGAVEISPEFLRLRQIFVFISDELKADVKTIQQEIVNLGGFEQKRGDWVQVIAVAAREEAEESDDEKDGGAKKITGGEKDDGDTGEKKDEGERARGEKSRPRGAFNEPKSTAHLLRARKAYFNEDYNRALDYILRAIKIEPENSQAYAMLGSLYYTINWKNLALKYWEKSLEIDPGNREVENLVAELRNRE